MHAEGRRWRESSDEASPCLRLGFRRASYIYWKYLQQFRPICQIVCFSHESLFRLFCSVLPCEASCGCRRQQKVKKEVCVWWTAFLSFFLSRCFSTRDTGCEERERSCLFVRYDELRRVDERRRKRSFHRNRVYTLFLCPLTASTATCKKET